MKQSPFYVNNRMTAKLEDSLSRIDTLEEFERHFPSEFLQDDDHVGNFLRELLWKYDKKESVVSNDAYLHSSYVGNIVNGKKRNPSRDALISICFAIGASVEETQYLLRYAGQAPLYVRRKRDVVIWFGLMKHLALAAVDEQLRQRGYTPLIKE